MNIPSTDDQTEKMIRVGAFNPDDLMFNQIGELSPRQQRWLKLEIAGWACQILINLTLTIAAWVIFYLQFRTTSQFFLGGAFWSIALGIGIWMCVENMRPVWRGLKDNEVKSVAGTLSKRSTFQYPGSNRHVMGYWALVIRSHTFNASPRIFYVVSEHQSYRIFYIPSLKRLINIEPLLAEEPQKKPALAALQAQAKEKEQSHE